MLQTNFEAIIRDFYYKKYFVRFESHKLFYFKSMIVDTTSTTSLPFIRIANIPLQYNPIE